MSEFPLNTVEELVFFFSRKFPKVAHQHHHQNHHRYREVNLLIDDPKDIGTGNGWESRAMTNADSGVVVP